MTLPRAALPLIASFALVGCASVPEVESRLRTLQFHPNMYVVQAGDTLESIAYRYQLSSGELAALNPGLSGRLPAGLRINVRPGTELPEAVRARAGWRPREGDDVGVAALRPETVRTIDDRTNASPVVVSAVSRPPVPEATLDDDVLLAEADTGRYGDEADDAAWPAVPDYPREEIVPDDLDIGPGDARAALDEELRRYVGRWTWPTDGALARRFSPGEANGQGIDIAGVPGQDVRAALDGKVVYSGRDLSGEGNLIIVRHDEALMTTYSHADQLFVAEDDEVLAGDPIASLGWNSKRESVLRFEVRRDGEALDPMTFLPATP